MVLGLFRIAHIMQPDDFDKTFSKNIHKTVTYIVMYVFVEKWVNNWDPPVVASTQDATWYLRPQEKKKKRETLNQSMARADIAI